MFSHHRFSLCTKHLRRPSCSRNSSWYGNYSISCWGRISRSYPQTGAMYYRSYFGMGKYALLSSEGGCALCIVFSLFWHNFLGCDCLCFQRVFDGTSVSFDEQNLSRNVMHNETWMDDVSYYPWTQSLLLDSRSTAQDFLGVATLDNGGG